MIIHKHAQKQEELETRLLQIWAQGTPESKTVEQVFGPYESWLLPIGNHQLLLHPVLKEWLYLDRLHDTWERTGFGPEEVVFVVQGGMLGARKKGEGALVSPVDAGQPGAIPAGEQLEVPPPAGAEGARACPACQAQVQTDDSFCSRCGAPLRALGRQAEGQGQAIICPACQHHNAAGTDSCAQCGARLG